MHIERRAPGQEGLAGGAVDIAIGVLPANAGAGCEADAVVQLAQMRQAQAEGAAEVVLGLALDV